MRKRREETRLHLSGPRGFGHHRQCAGNAINVGQPVWVKNAMNRSHSVAVPALFSFAKSVLVASVLPNFSLFPWLRREQILKRARREYRCFVRFPITIPSPD